MQYIPDTNAAYNWSYKILHLVRIETEMNEMDNYSQSTFIKYHFSAPYRAVEVDFGGFEVHFMSDIGQVMISVTFILTEIVL